ncbi:MAG: SDR family NAD(P)-dependent oxidoreductase [Nitrososphaera sp.]|jgi:UDP-glucose 4-epimerase
MKIFVTGGSGFIGRYTVVALLKAGNSVTIYDNQYNSSKTTVRYLIEKGAKFVKGDITNYKQISRSISGFDAVVHLAAQIDVQESIRDPLFTHHVNTTGTLNLLNACIENNVKNIVAASTAAVYGESAKQSISENSPVNPISPYGVSKLSMEFYLKVFSSYHDLNCVSLRFFNVYGAGQSDAYAGVITKFVDCIQKNKSLVIFGNGSNTRDFVSVSDAVSAIQLALEKIKGKKGNCYNIASGKYTTIKDLAYTMISISRKPLQIKYQKARKGDIRKSQPTILLAKKELGYRPKIDLQDGLQELIKAI